MKEQITQLTTKDLKRLRAIALDSQGLTKNAPFGRGIGATQKTIEHLGYVQIDTISVVERAHHHVLRTRVPNYENKHLDRLLKRGQVFEYWAHAAAYLPMRDFRFSLPMKAGAQNGLIRAPRSNDKKLMKELIQRIRNDGPLRSRDIEDPKTEAGGWWNWKPAKRALEHLFFTGELMIAARDGFQKTYDLPERVVPEGIDTSMPSYQEYAEHLLDSQLRCHGFATLKGITYLRRDAALRKATKELVNAHLDAGDLQALRLPDGQIIYAEPGLLERRTRLSTRAMILSPFDNAVIQRDRLIDFFGFDYQIECYVPEPKRKHGYFCLPLLLGADFIGRVDAKAHRTSGVLEIKNLQLDNDQRDRGPALDQLQDKLADAIIEFAAFQGCSSVRLTKTARSLATGLPAKIEHSLKTIYGE